MHAGGLAIRRVGVEVNFGGFFVSASSGQDRAEMAHGGVDCDRL